MNESILISIKKAIGGLSESYEHFDPEIIMHINSIFIRLMTLGVGPKNGFQISDKFSTWADFLGTDEVFYNDIKTYITLKVRLIFDPPASSVLTQQINASISELESLLVDRHLFKEEKN